MYTEVLRICAVESPAAIHAECIGSEGVQVATELPGQRKDGVQTKNMRLTYEIDLLHNERMVLFGRIRINRAEDQPIIDSFGGSTEDQLPSPTSAVVHMRPE